MPAAHRRRPSIEPLEGRALLASLMVTNTLDSGPGSLRQAITDADAATGATTIDFAIPGTGIQRIPTLTELPMITMPMTIDATTQPGYAGSPLIVINGRQALNSPYPNLDIGLGFYDGSSGSMVEGLAIEGFGAEGIYVGGPKVAIDDNFIGVDPAGQAGAGNVTGIVLSGAFSGTSTPGTIVQGNTVGNGSTGISLVESIGATISGNFIGTDAAGTAKLGNALDGIFAGSGVTGATIQGNTIANNGGPGIDDQSKGGLTLSGNTLSNNGGPPITLSVVASTASVTGGLGQVVATTFTLTNNGPEAAEDATLAVALRDAGSPFGVPGSVEGVATLAGAAVSQGTVAPLRPLFGSLEEYAQFGTLAAGASASVTVTARIIGPGDDGFDAVAGTTTEAVARSVPDATTLIAARSNADIAVASLPAPVARVGVPETFRFIITNTGPTDETDPLFALSFAPSAGAPQVGVLTSQGTVMALAAYPDGFGGDIGTLAAGASATITAVIIPTATGKVSAAVYAYSPENTDADPANNLAFAASPVASATAPSVLGATLLPTVGAASAVAVYFDNPLDAAEARNVRNYAVRVIGSAVAVRSATYDAATHVVTLRLSRALARPANLRLVVGGAGSPGLAGLDGSKLVDAGVALTLN